MKIQFACRIDAGLRDCNDDRALIPGRLTDEGVCRAEADAPALAAVCDGCGGYAGGGLAAGTVLEALAGIPPQELADVEGLSGALEAAERAVLQKKRALPQYAEMCAAVAGCVFDGDRTLIFHAGDSRVYRYDGVNLARMTVDHSVVQSMVDLGRLTEEEALCNPQRSVLSRCVGIGCQPPDIYVARPGIQPGEIFLICSDGLWESVRDCEIRALLSRRGDPLALAERLAERALENGGGDNITVCLCLREGGARPREDTPFFLD